MLTRIHTLLLIHLGENKQSLHTTIDDYYYRIVHNFVPPLAVCSAVKSPIILCRQLFLHNCTLPY